MRIFDHSDLEHPEDRSGICVAFTRDEEVALARAVLSLLSERVFRGDDRDFLEEIFWHRRCRYAGRLWAEDFMQTMDIYERWAKLDFFPIIIPDFANDNRSLFDDPAGAATLVLLIWKGEWERQKQALIGLNDEFKEFPGDSSLKEDFLLRKPEAALERSGEIEEKFWAEVNRVREHFGTKLSASDCYDYVRDYHKRGRDLIPRVLAAKWAILERTLPEVIEGSVPHPQEDWFDQEIAYAREKESYMSEEAKIVR